MLNGLLRSSQHKSQKDVDKGRTPLQMLSIPYSQSTSMPSAAFTEQVLRQTESLCTPNGTSQAKLLPSSKISIPHNSVKGITRIRTQTPTTPDVSVHMENKAPCKKASTLLCSSYSCGLVHRQSSKMRWCNSEIKVVIRSPWTRDAQNVFNVNPLVMLFIYKNDSHF